jgi:hypothetical protein
MCEGGGRGGERAELVGDLVAKPSIRRACVREEDAGGREAGAPLDLKMPLENGRADERVSRGQASERAVCVCDGICRDGGTPSPAADGRRVPARMPPPPPPRHNGSVTREPIFTEEKSRRFKVRGVQVSPAHRLRSSQRRQCQA